MEINVHPNSILGKSRAALAFWHVELPRLRALLQQRQAELSHISGQTPSIGMSALEIFNLNGLKKAGETAVEICVAAVKNAEMSYGQQEYGAGALETQVRNLVSTLENEKKRGVDSRYTLQLLGGLIGEKT